MRLVPSLLSPLVIRHLTARSYYNQCRPNPLRLPSGYPSLLPLVLSSSNLILQQSLGDSHYLAGTRIEDGSIIDEEPVIPFFLSAPMISRSEQSPIGFIRPEVSKALEEDHQDQINGSSKSPWDLNYHTSLKNTLSSIAFAAWVNREGRHARTTHMARLIHSWKYKQMFGDILRGWSDESYPIFHHAPHRIASVSDTVAFTIERAALPLFGFANFGCLLTAYFFSENTGTAMIWVPRRSATKRTWPGKLDVTVGGGISAGDTALSTIIKECAEEASLDTTYVRNNVRSVGVLPFPNRSPTRWILPGVYYLYDLQLPSDGSVMPQINAADGEVETFELMDAETVVQNLVEGRFKASSAMAIVDFLIRHGLITEASDSRYADVCKLLKGNIILPVPWR